MGKSSSSTPAPSFFCPVPTMAPTPGSVVINEIMRNPTTALNEPDGEWLELFNPGGQDIDINGYTLRDAGGDSHVIDNGGPLILPAGGYLVLGANGDMGANGGVALDYVYSNFLLANAADEVILEDLAGDIADSVSFDAGATFPNPEGASIALIDPLVDNDVGSNWCTTVSNAQTQYGPTANFGTPGGPNICPDPLPAGGSVVINEIMYNPSSITDTNGEWIELHNPGTAAVNINGWEIADNAGAHTITNNGDLIIPPGGYVVLGRNADAGTNGGVTVDYEYSGIFLGNGGDVITISDGFGNAIDVVNYGVAGFPNADGASLNLDDPTADNSMAANWCLSTSLCCGGDSGTPGLANDACP